VTDALATLRSSKGELRVVADDGREITLQHVDVTAHFPLMTKASRRPPDNAPPPPAAPPR
jgi:hypothetical protein